MKRISLMILAAIVAVLSAILNPHLVYGEPLVGITQSQYKFYGIFFIAVIVFIALSYLVLKLYINHLRRIIHGERELSKDVFDHADLFIWAVHRDKQVLRVNKYAQRLIGMGETDILGKKYNELLYVQDYYVKLVELMDDALGMKFVEHKEITLKSSEQGTPRTFLFRTAAINGISGNPDVFICCGIDIHDRKLNEKKLQNSYQELERIYEELALTQEEMQVQLHELISNQDKLRESEERFRLASLGSGAVIWDTDPATGNYYVSDRFYDLLGYNRMEMPATEEQWRSLVHPDDVIPTDKMRQACINGKSPVYEAEYRMIKKNGEHLWIQARGMIRRNDEGTPVRFSGSMIDITERKSYEIQLEHSYQELEETYEELAATQEELRNNYDALVVNERRLRRSEERYKLVAESSNGGIWEIDLIENRRYYSSRWFQLLGYQSEEDVTTELLEYLLHPEDAERVDVEMKATQSGEKPFFECEYRLRKKNGEYNWFIGRGKVLFDEHGQACRMAGSDVDIHELKISQERLKHLAYYDELSDLPNRLYLLEELESYLSYSQGKAALFFIDLDNFKYINDTLGHKLGDRILKKVSLRLSALVGEECMLFRLGGDEFVILQMDIENEAEAEGLASILIQGFKEPFRIHESDLYVSISIGISFFPQDGISVEEILKNADVAMYNAKEAGKGKYMVFRSSFLTKFNERVSVEKYLREAIKGNQFVLYYQPQVSLKTGQIVGFESLIRWNSPEFGFVSPISFIKIAEDSRLIVPIGEWVLSQSCTFARSLHDLGHGDYKISVNISVVQLIQEEFVDMVLRILHDTALNPAYLELEITESVFIESFEIVIPKLEFLKSLGIQIALDDFGTGYSSLGYLKQMPITTLKVDRTFIEEVPDQQDHHSLARAIVLIGRRMGLMVVAEGVETKQQLKHVKRAKCDVIQGYFISQPLKEEEVIRLVQTHQVYEM
ncbi:sensor domain-containing protein [Paenibacillus segetis]|uniref:PAS domain S-box-containing protein/diguanylate cyclase (GGDEF) domain-containing protein n=1 Tax=Paenibacillus segetis TaxID=1325360 RepID=A0ABQ1YSK2_9BACL|nr:EAL domain-containing protein [Paenibacillus segetis]GGH37187.1 hypothetical protein GCM10008013_44510 [Paenibacillus segetis]